MPPNGRSPAGQYSSLSVRRVCMFLPVLFYVYVPISRCIRDLQDWTPISTQRGSPSSSYRRYRIFTQWLESGHRHGDRSHQILMQSPFGIGEYSCVEGALVSCMQPKARPSKLCPRIDWLFSMLNPQVVCFCIRCNATEIATWSCRSSISVDFCCRRIFCSEQPGDLT